MIQATSEDVAFRYGDNMKAKNLLLYQVDLKYIRDLSKVDDKIPSVSPQIGKQHRPVLGVVIIKEDKQYCIPLMSGNKAKYDKMNNTVDLIKIPDPKSGKTIGVLNINNMFPVYDDVIKPLELKIGKNDSAEIKQRKKLMAKELTWCQKNDDLIQRRANRLYRLITTGKANSYLRNRCCDFQKLEKECEKYQRRQTNRDAR